MSLNLLYEAVHRATPASWEASGEIATRISPPSANTVDSPVSMFSKLVLYPRTLG